MKNFTVFLIKTAVLFVVFWLLSKLMSTNEAFQSIPNWGVWLILAAAASLFDYVVDVLIKPDGKLAGYTQYTARNLA